MSGYSKTPLMPVGVQLHLPRARGEIANECHNLTVKKGMFY